MKRGIAFILAGLILVFGASIAMNFGDIWETMISFPTSHADCIFAFLAGAVLMGLIDWLVPSSKSKKKHHNTEQ